MDEIKTTALDNGPYLVKGPMKLLDAGGNEFRAGRLLEDVRLWRQLDLHSIRRGCDHRQREQAREREEKGFRTH